MPCYKPLDAYQTAAGDVIFHRNAKNITKEFQLPCGQCVGCRLERSRQWAMRCVHESKMHKENSFVTLTYDDDNIPTRNTLVYEHWQLFAKRLRKKIEPQKMRFYMCGEYGDTTGRPHYHALLFGIDWNDKQYFSEGAEDSKLYTSETLTKIWGMGHCITADLTFKSAAYCARYVMKKQNGKDAEEHYRRTDELGTYQLEPEFSGMSLKPGIGQTWFEKYSKDVTNGDFVIINGKETKPPKYYDTLLKRDNNDKYIETKERREYEGYLRREDNTPSRLQAKEHVTKAKINQFKRAL